MEEKKYTVAEIDAMREAIRFFGWPPNSGPYRPDERAKEVEDRVRTYMVAGVDPEDVKNQLRSAWSAELSRQSEVVRTEIIHGVEVRWARNGSASWSGDLDGKVSKELKKRYR